jgi:ubiquinone/menaquinone biosynthesis C-methylase UbiE
MEPHDALIDEIRGYYTHAQEQARLTAGVGLLEYLRTCDLLARYLPPPPAVVLDVGGGAGAYALTLATQGYLVDLIDPVPLHIEQALRSSHAQPAPLRRVEIGDARQLAWPDGSVDAVLLLGPLYHLPERSDRSAALREAYRVLRPQGVIVAAAISRCTSTLDGLRGNAVAQPDFARQVTQALQDGRRHNPPAYAHLPDELRQEMIEAGFQLEALVAVEGPGWLIPEINAQLADPVRRETILSVLRTIEGEPGLAGASQHMVGVARRA